MMNENRETITDIVEAMRGRGEDGRMDMSLWRDYADRIEAAWKRERAEVEADALEVGGIVEAARTAEKSSAFGNVAAMRDALLNIQEYAAAMDVDDGNVLAILDACRDALAWPARNCDLYDDAEIALRAWLEDKDNWDEFGSPRLELCEWLFAPAVERKGAGDA